MRRYIWLFVSCLVAVSAVAFKSSDGYVPKKIKDPSQIATAGNAPTLHFLALVGQYGYTAEAHKVTTKDGYILELHRISGSPVAKNTTGTKPVVFLQHGFLCSSDFWVLYGPNKDLAFLLADAGYDVWVGNSRGNSYSYHHLTLTTKDKEFWDFSYQEMALLDLPAAFDYILSTTGQENLEYIGHSMGTTMILALLSTKPEYNAKVKCAVLLAAVSQWLHPQRTLFEYTFLLASTFRWFLDAAGIYYILPEGALPSIIGDQFCANSAPIGQPICTTLYGEVFGWDIDQLNITTFPYVLRHLPAGASTRTIYHYSQDIKSGEFKRYDYGCAEENQKHYNQDAPPAWKVEDIKTRIAMFYGPNDILASKEDAEHLQGRLQNVVHLEAVCHEFFNHMDFALAIDAKALLYDKVIGVLDKYK